jgi:hypothetical protein
MEYNLSFEDLMKLCSKRIFAKNYKVPGPIKGAINGGDYMGRPGRDIFFSLPKLDEDQFNKVVDKLSLRFSHRPPHTHVAHACCFRYIYGQFKGLGILGSEEDLQWMQEKEIDWSLPRKFMSALRDKFFEQENYYGLCLYYEMEAHRLGDEAFLNNDESKRKDMEWHYLKSVECAHKCGSLKHKFTPYFWCFKYYARMGDNKKGLEYVLKTLEIMEKYLPHLRDSGYLEKANDCMEYLKKNHNKEWNKEWNKVLNNYCIRRAVHGF